HIEAAIEIIPAWWGVMRIRDRADDCRLTVVRSSRINRDVDLLSLVRLLWRFEALEELEALGLAQGLERSPKRILWQRLADAVPSAISRPKLQERVRFRLRTREGWRADRPQTTGDDSS